MSTINIISVFIFISIMSLLIKQYFQTRLYEITQELKNIKLELLYERKKNEQKNNLLLQNSKLASLGELLENITHQWREPLTVISAVTMQMKIEEELGGMEYENIGKSIAVISSSVKQCSEMLNSFYILFQSSPHKTDFLINKSLLYIVNILKPQFNNKNIKFKFISLNTEITTYKSELMQVFMHIIGNSIEVINKQPCSRNYIFARIKQNTHSVIIEIYDNAKGINEVYLPKVFDMCFTTKGDDGSGVGLYISKKIIENKLGGKLSVSNYTYIYKGDICVGAKFCIELPKDVPEIV